MNDVPAPAPSRPFRALFWIGWRIPLFFLAAFALNHIGGIWYIAQGYVEQRAIWLTIGPVALAIVFGVRRVRPLKGRRQENPWRYQGFSAVGDTGLEPMTSSV